MTFDATSLGNQTGHQLCVMRAMGSGKLWKGGARSGYPPPRTVTVILYGGALGRDSHGVGGLTRAGQARCDAMASGQMAG